MYKYYVSYKIDVSVSLAFEMGSHSIVLFRSGLLGRPVLNLPGEENDIPKNAPFGTIESDKALIDNLCDIYLKILWDQLNI